MMGSNIVTSLLPVPKPDEGRDLVSHLGLPRHEQHQRALEEGAAQELAFVDLHLTLERRPRLVCPGHALRAKNKWSASSLLSIATPGP